MKVREIQDCLQAKLLYGEDELDREVKYGFGADLMSDVLAFVKDDTVLLTGLTSPHVIRTAEMLDIMVVVFVRGKVPGEDIVEMAEERDIAIMCTPYTMFEASGILYQKGLEGSNEHNAT
jgi:predicted transcriptional regulator